MKFKVILLSMYACFLVGCTPNSASGVREKHASKYSFVTNKNYQRSYRTILENSRKCYQTGLVTAQLIVQGDLYTDIKEGNVTVALHGGLGVDVYSTVDIKEVSKNKTNITVYSATKGNISATRAVKKWIENGTNSCKA